MDLFATHTLGSVYAGYGLNLFPFLVSLPVRRGASFALLLQYLAHKLRDRSSLLGCLDSGPMKSLFFKRDGDVL
jgi:hypothetical protein